MLDRLGDVVERRVPVDLVAGGLEERVPLLGARRRDRGGRNHPDRHAFVAAGEDVAGVAQGSVGVGGVQRTGVHVVEPPPSTDEHLPQRTGWSAHAAPDCRPAACLAAYAAAASRTQAPSSWARTLCAIRAALHGPLPLTTSNSSVKSISPKSKWPRSSFHRISGSGSESPSAWDCGTVMST